MKMRSHLNKQSVISNEQGFKEINKGQQLDKEYRVSSEQGVSCLKSIKGLGFQVNKGLISTKSQGQNDDRGLI